MVEGRPRYTRSELPPYSYVPGHAPHPVSHPAGHMHGETHQNAEPLQPDDWQSSGEYLYGIDLFNHGYYWEAHEAWESLWHAAGRKGQLADFLKGLIKLAAAAVKAREGNPRGVARHAKRSRELVSVVPEQAFCGLQISLIVGFVDTLVRSAEQYHQPQPELLLPFVIEPETGKLRSANKRNNPTP